jgi:hypothetical protein
MGNHDKIWNGGSNFKEEVQNADSPLSWLAQISIVQFRELEGIAVGLAVGRDISQSHTARKHQ